MSRLRRAAMVLSLALILVWFALSVYGAFLGAAEARALVNRVPLAVYWIVLAAMLAAGVLLFPRLRRRPGLLAIHVGAVLVILGGMWGSEAGHRLQERLLGRDKLRMGQMVIYESLTENRVLPETAGLGYALDPNDNAVIYELDAARRPVLVADDDPRIFRLPFSVRLIDFRIEFYEPPRLLVDHGDEPGWSIQPVEPGMQYDLDGHGTLTILDVYRNLRVGAEGEVIDEAGPGWNPAVRVQIDLPDGTQQRRFVFARFAGHHGEQGPFRFRYVAEGMPKDYFSDLEVVEDGRVVLAKTIEVNDPLHYGGYHFYQSDYDHEGHAYTVLMVASDSGLICVWIGYALLAGGIILHMWLSPLLAARQKRSEAAHGT